MKLQHCERKPTSWSSGNVFVSESGSLRFKFWTGQIGHRFANSSLPLRQFFERNCVAGRCNDVKMSLATRYTFRRITASIMDDLIWLMLNALMV